MAGSGPPESARRQRGKFQSGAARADRCAISRFRVRRSLKPIAVVSAESSHKHEEQGGKVHFCEFGRKALYRRLLLPRPIDLDKVSATLQEGVLRISAQEAQMALVTRVQAAA
jgi:Hsp20/alpha crystallin family